MGSCPYNCKNGRIFNTVSREYQPCPHCGNVLREVQTPTGGLVNLLDQLCIPAEHQQDVFEPQSFFEPESDRIFSQASYQAVLSVLSSLESAIRSGQFVCESMYIYTGVYSKSLSFVFACLRYAIQHNLTAVPYVSLKDLSGIRAQTEQTSRVYSNITWYDYTTADICFVAATASVDTSDASILADLLQERERHGLPTYVIGYWGTSALIANKKTIRFLISQQSNRLGLLKPYEILTKAHYQDMFRGNYGAMGVVTDVQQARELVLKSSLGLCGVAEEKYNSKKGLSE